MHEETYAGTAVPAHTDDPPPYVQDPLFPPEWWSWQTGDQVWHARPAGHPNPIEYVQGASKIECADRAWFNHRRRLDGAAG